VSRRCLAFFLSFPDPSILAGLHKFPQLGAGPIRFLIHGEKLTRPEAARLYLHHQTGLDVGLDRVSAFLNRTLRKASATDSNRVLISLSNFRFQREHFFLATVTRLFWRKASTNHVNTHDWTEELGPNLFPNSKLSSSPAKPKKKKRARTVFSDGDDDRDWPGGKPLGRYSAANDETRESTVRSPPLKRRKQAPRHLNRFTVSPPRSTGPSSVPHPSEQPLASDEPLPSISSISRIGAPSPSPPASANTSTPAVLGTPAADVLSSSALSAFLTSFAPSHNFASASLTLHLAGLSSLGTLVSLLFAGQGTYERAIEQIVKQGKMSEKVGEWVSFAMGEAKREWAGQ
jgi:hypothetical protein